MDNKNIKKEFISPKLEIFMIHDNDILTISNGFYSQWDNFDEEKE